MIFRLQDLTENPPAFFAFLAAFAVAIVTGIAFHEFSHAWAANELGDDTAARQGRLTLNPIKHLEPVGTLMIFLIGFGRGRPTPVNPYRLRYGPKRGNALVAAAGPLSNFVFAVLLALPIRFGLIDSIGSWSNIREASGGEIVGLFLLFAVYLNVLLGIFNLIPIPPLDGFSVALVMVPDEYVKHVMPLAEWGPGILITLIVVGFVTPFNPIGFLIGGIAEFVINVVV